MNLNRTLAILAGTAALCAVTAASPVVATTALVTAGIGLLGGLPVIDAREGRRKRFEDTQVTNAYRDIRQTSYEQQCCQSKSGHIYSNVGAYPLWETCKSLSERKGEKLINVPPQAINASVYSPFTPGNKPCISTKTAAKINTSIIECDAKPMSVTPPSWTNLTRVKVDFNQNFDIGNELIGVRVYKTYDSILGGDTCDSFPVILELPDEELFYDAVTDLPPVPESTKIIAGLGTALGAGSVAAAVVGCVVGAKKVKDKCKSEEAINDDKVEMLTSEDAPPSYTQAVEDVPSKTSQGASA